MSYKGITKNHGFWLFMILFLLGIFYLNLVWKALGNVDELTTHLLFYGAIFGLIWQRKEKIKLNSNIFPSFVGLSLLVIIITKTIYLFSFEDILFSLVPFCAGISLALIASGFRGLGQYSRELFFAWFLFFPEGVIGHFIDNLARITVFNAKLSTYFLYYFGFNVANVGNEVVLSLPNVGDYKAIVDYPCAGMPMILLMLKLSLLLVSFFRLSKFQCFLIPIGSIAIGFFLGVVRVCILTLAIPKQTTFNYWHGAEGSQIFSTIAILIFSAFAYWLLNRNNFLESPKAT